MSSLRGQGLAVPVFLFELDSDDNFPVYVRSGIHAIHYGNIWPGRYTSTAQEDVVPSSFTNVSYFPTFLLQRSRPVLSMLRNLEITVSHPTAKISNWRAKAAHHSRNIILQHSSIITISSKSYLFDDCGFVLCGANVLDEVFLQCPDCDIDGNDVPDMRPDMSEFSFYCGEVLLHCFGRDTLSLAQDHNGYYEIECKKEVSTEVLQWFHRIRDNQEDILQNDLFVEISSDPNQLFRNWLDDYPQRVIAVGAPVRSGKTEDASQLLSS